MDLLKEVTHELSPILTDLINTLLKQGTFPMELKKALLQPLLKKAILDSMIKNNFRSISNLAFSGKLMEHILNSAYNKKNMQKFCFIIGGFPLRLMYL